MDIAPNQGAADNRIWLRFCGRRAHLSSHHHHQRPRLELDIKNGWSVEDSHCVMHEQLQGNMPKLAAGLDFFVVLGKAMMRRESGRSKDLEYQTPSYLPVLVVRRCCLLREPNLITSIPFLLAPLPGLAPLLLPSAAAVVSLGYFHHPAISRVDHEYQPGCCCYFARRQTSILHC